jgi:hypothetical protein
MFVGGVLYWAVPMFMFNVADTYSRWKLYGASSDHLSTTTAAWTLISLTVPYVMFWSLHRRLQSMAKRGAITAEACKLISSSVGWIVTLAYLFLPSF